MTSLYLFNPENDIALAFGGASFTPAKNVVTFSRDCALLPAWYADDDAAIITPEELSGAEVALLQRFNISAKRYNKLDVSEITSVKPWGWSLALRNRLMREGVAATIMPDDVQLEKIRMLSHRHTSLLINGFLSNKGINVPQGVVELNDIDSLVRLLDGGGAYMLKMPWSSSGRGVVDSRSLSRDEVKRRFSGVIAKQGSVVAEPLLDDVMDFAMLFKMEGGKAEFAGYSVFENHGGAAYSGNIVASQSYLRKLISGMIDPATLDAVQSALTEALTQIIGNAYSGYCGVDMMAYKYPGGKIALAPCIELNLRMTMGVVALRLSRFIPEGLVAKMTVTAPRQLQDAVIEDNKLVQGEVNLTPRGERFAVILSVNDIF